MIFIKEIFSPSFPLDCEPRHLRSALGKTAVRKTSTLLNFDDETNVGVVLGDASGGLIDIDLDCEQALTLAPIFLPPTGFRFGRKSKPKSHHFYRSESPGKTVRLADSNGRTLLECRGNGGQTVVPPSLHPTGELIEFSEKGLAGHSPTSTTWC